MEIYAQGKRGVIYRQDNVCVKEKNPRSAVDTLKNESEYLKLLNAKGIGPKFIKYSDGKLFREFVDGIRISDFFEQENDRKKIISVIKQVLEQCREMDLLGMNKKELTNPYKDILVTADNKGNVKPVMIDFERCYETKKTKNVTQFMQYINRSKPTLAKKGIIIDRQEMIRLGKEYKEKNDKESFNNILSLIK
jgi:predicted Ser/Thr protein kinase